MNIGNLEPINHENLIIALGIEGSANKIGVGILFFSFFSFLILIKKEF